MRLRLYGCRCPSSVQACPAALAKDFQQQQTMEASDQTGVHTCKSLVTMAPANYSFASVSIRRQPRLSLETGQPSSTTGAAGDRSSELALQRRRSR